MIKKLLIILITISSFAYAASPFQNWQTLEIENFSINYQKKYLPYAQRTALILKKVHQNLTKKVQWTPKEKTQVILLDDVDYSNGGATPLPYNTIIVYMNAPNGGELLDHTSWLELLLTHEYTHVLQIDQVAGAPKTIRSIFGKDAGLFTVQTIPQAYAPHWLSEGYAVYNESLQGQGRGNSAIYESKMRQEVLNGLKSYSEVSYEGYYGSRWPFGLVYLYGAYFFEFLDKTYGKEKLTKYITSYSSNLVPWKMDSRAIDTFDKSAVELWAEYQDYLKTKFAPQITNIKTNQQDIKLVVDDKFRNGLITKGPDNSIIYYFSNAMNKPEIKQVFPDGTQKTLLKISGVDTLDWQPKKGLLITKIGVCENTNYYFNTYHFNLKTKKLSQLSDCQRLAKATWSKNSQNFYAIKNEGMKQTLVKVVGKKIIPLYKFSLGDVMGNFDISQNDKTIIASVKREKTGWNLEQFNLKTQQWQLITTSGYKERSPKFFSENKIYFIADNKSHQQMELYSLNLNSNTKQQHTNSLGFVSGFVVTKKGAWLQKYSAKNEQIYYLKSLPVLSEFENIDNLIDLSHLITSQDDFAPDTLVNNIRKYSSFDTLGANAWQPLLNFSEQESQAGVLLKGQDVLGFHRWLLAPTYYYHKDIDKVGGIFNYGFYNHLNILAQKQIKVKLDNTDEDNPIVKSYDETTTGQVLVNYLINTSDWRLNFNAGIANKKVETNIIKPSVVSETKDTISGAIISFNNLSVYSHSISYTEGFSLDITSEKYSEDSDHKGNAQIANLGIYIPIINKQVLEISALYAKGDETIKPFQLGGSSDLLGDVGSGHVLGRRDFALRGYKRTSALKGTRIARANITYNFPIAKIYDGWSVFPMGIGDIYANIFYEAGSAWNEGDIEKKQYKSHGAQITFDWLIGFDSIKLPVTIGVAKGLDKDLGETQSYVKIGFEF